jgi:methionyl-tRNA formyltransferase
MRIAVAATPPVALPTLDLLKSSKYQLVRVITRPDRPTGRGRNSQPTVVAQWADENNIDCHKPEDDVQLAQSLHDVDLLITIGFGVILSKELLKIPSRGSINLHFSLLPRWRGAAPVQRAIEAGDHLSGVTVFQLDEGMDTGPIFVTKRFAIDSDITSDELLHELSQLGPEAIVETLALIENGKKPTAQDSAGATLARKLTKIEGKIDWTNSAESIHSKVRAFTSNPGAWTVFRNENLILQQPEISALRLKPGQIEVRDKKLHVGTATSALSFLKVKPSGKPLMDASAWINGVRISAEEFFGE